MARLPPKFLVQQEAKFTLQHSGKNVFFIAFLFYIQIMYINILEGLILNRTKHLAGLLMTVNEDKKFS